MEIGNYPPKIPKPFGINAAPADVTYPIPTASQIGITLGAASFNDGFPPACFQQVSAGGKGPLGSDFIGLFKQITAALQYTQAGAILPWDSAFSAQIGGYLKNALVASNTVTGLFWISTIDNNLSNPDSGGAGWNATALGATIQWDAASPPSVDVMLPPGAKAAITFENVTSLPLKIATAQGLYRIVIGINSNNSTNSDAYLLPNNTTFTNAFSRSSIEATDQEITGFGSATSDVSTTVITGGVGTYVASVPGVAATGFSLGAFFLDLFYGPSSFDTINDKGPFLIEMLAQTVTSAKLVKATSAILGGPATAASLWSDTLTTWSSLGTFEVWVGTGTNAPPGMNVATISGTAFIERLI